MIQKTDISVFIFDPRSVFVLVVIKQLEGERDYGQQTVATFTFVRLHFCRGVVHMAVVRVKVQGVKRMCFINDRTIVYTCTRSIFAQTKKVSYSLFYCVVKARIVFMKSKRLAVTEQ